MASAITDAVKQEFKPDMTGRLFTALDANLPADCQVVPELELELRELNEDHQKIFTKAKAHHDRQKPLLEYIKYAISNPDVPPENRLLDNLCRQVDSKWICGLIGCRCSKPDTLEHKRMHLRGNAHFPFKFFRCHAWYGCSGYLYE